jgi:Protein of unknown function (DUF3052)
MAGYSGTPLPQKLGIQPQARLAFVELPADVSKALKAAISGCQIEDDETEALDFAMAFVKAQSELKKQFPRLARRLAPAGMLWVSWPKKASGVATDLTEDKVREIGLQNGLVDVKVCAVNETWSGLKFLRRLKDRPRRAKA